LEIDLNYYNHYYCFIIKKVVYLLLLLKQIGFLLSKIKNMDFYEIKTMRMIKKMSIIEKYSNTHTNILFNF